MYIIHDMLYSMITVDPRVFRHMTDWPAGLTGAPHFWQFGIRLLCASGVYGCNQHHSIQLIPFAFIELYPRVFRHIQDRLACSLAWCSIVLAISAFACCLPVEYMGVTTIIHSSQKCYEICWADHAVNLC
jgi:hypothetical protein